MAAPTAARRAAYATLCAARERDAYVRELLNSPAAPATLARLSAEDRAFARRLALGVVATQGTLDELIDRFASHPDRLDPAVRDALRLAIYEMAFLGKPSHVAVSQGVELVKTRAKSAAGLANAVLRRAGEAVGAFMAESDAHRFGLPPWLLGRVQAELGDGAAYAFGCAQNEPAPVYVANVPMCIPDADAAAVFAADGMAVEKCGAVPGAWRALDPAAVGSCAALASDQAVVADYAAQTVAFLATPSVGDRMLEVGSGRATKTILMAGQLFREGGAARIWALDLHSYKAGLAAERLAQARVQGVTQVSGDGRDLDACRDLPAHFEHILVDAPCSGTGTLRRHPEIIWTLTPEDVTSCAHLQQELLAAAAARVAPGGILSYATCSVLHEENEEVVQAFLASPAGEGFEVKVPEDAAGIRNAAVAEEVAGRTTPDGYFRTLPEAGGCDGHFCASLCRVRQSE